MAAGLLPRLGFKTRHCGKYDATRGRDGVSVDAGLAYIRAQFEVSDDCNLPAVLTVTSARCMRIRQRTGQIADERAYNAPSHLADAWGSSSNSRKPNRKPALENAGGSG